MWHRMGFESQQQRSKNNKIAWRQIPPSTLYTLCIISNHSDVGWFIEKESSNLTYVISSQHAAWQMLQRNWKQYYTVFHFHSFSKWRKWSANLSWRSLWVFVTSQQSYNYIYIGRPGVLIYQERNYSVPLSYTEHQDLRHKWYCSLPFYWIRVNNNFTGIRPPPRHSEVQRLHIMLRRIKKTKHFPPEENCIWSAIYCPWQSCLTSPFVARHRFTR